MPAPDEVLIGVREGSSLDRYMFERGVLKYAGRCLDCGHQVFVKPSAWELFSDWDHDPKVICDMCNARDPALFDTVQGL